MGENGREYDDVIGEEGVDGVNVVSLGLGGVGVESERVWVSWNGRL